MKNLLEKIRAFFVRAFTHLFAAPYLPGSLLWIALGLAGLDLLRILVGQPGLYWMDFSQAQSELPFLKAVLAAHPLAYVGAALAYLLLAWGLLGLLTRRLALVGWVMLAFVHLMHLFAWAVQLLGLLPAGAKFAPAFTLAETGLAALLLGAALALLLLRPQKALVAAGVTDTAAVQEAPQHRLRFLQNRRWQLGLAALVLLILAGGSFALLRSQQQGWVLLKPVHSPGRRTSSAVVYDSQHKRALLFGGGSEWVGVNWVMHNDLWQWDGQDWSEIQTKTRPSPRMNHLIAFDEKRGVLVLFGGETVSGQTAETWEWDGQDWKQIYAGGGAPQPGTRIGHALFFDPQLEQVVLSGGYGGKTSAGDGVFYRDAWAWDGKTWRELGNKELNPYVTGATAALDPTSEQVVAVNYDSLLTWNGEQWARASLDPQPPARKDARMVSIPGRGLALFGGAIDDEWQNDLWLLDRGQWKEMKAGMRPSARTVPAMFYDEARGQVIVYGGYDTHAAQSDMWAYTLPR